MKDTKKKNWELSPQEAMIILDFIQDSEIRLLESNDDKYIKDIMKITLFYLKERAKIFLNEADRKFSEVMNGR